mmetsp:Transcript_44981/g.48673  ORF Transcript_44981/g.48673 Transcript_44981/m.48673 type:complete len:116 (+) Transcript_44981:196-543(+)
MKLKLPLSSSLIPFVVAFGLLVVRLASTDLYMDVKKVGSTKTTWSLDTYSSSTWMDVPIQKEQPPKHLPCVWIPLTNIRRQNQPACLTVLLYEALFFTIYPVHKYGTNTPHCNTV